MDFYQLLKKIIAESLFSSFFIDVEHTVLLSARSGDSLSIACYITYPSSEQQRFKSGYEDTDFGTMLCLGFTSHSISSPSIYCVTVADRSKVAVLV